ncbi:MAG TPA: COX aromatic rich motif-containing protein [Candidatus Limnocylindrales bacterium]|nr:COX aromatic rich motif-containing protein [Candidatus Limnocylindrales bacterium]
MMKHENKVRGSKPVSRMVYALTFLSLLALTIAVLLKDADVALLNPKGLIALEQYKLFLISSFILLLIAVPTLFLFYYMAWKYRETNDKAIYDPHVRQGKGLTLSIWAIPIVFMVVLGGIMWSATHRLEPQKAIAANAKPITVQVVALRWKWLFIYPEHNIATVNFVQIPTDTPIRFELTADEVSMSSFWIPHLGGQLYAMTGHVNPLNLMAEKPGDYPGSSAELNGHGFAGMKFIARASSNEVYKSWVSDVQLNSTMLTADGYKEMLKPSENNNVAFYNLADSKLHDKVVMKYTGSHEVHTRSHKEH